MTVDLPKFVVAPDYHDFDQIQSTLQKLDVRFRCVEVGRIVHESISPYLGVIYQGGKKPTKEELEALLAIPPIAKQFTGAVTIN
jgi:hypothetical protein